MALDPLLEDAALCNTFIDVHENFAQGERSRLVSYI
jgi:hypothetical protein